MKLYYLFASLLFRSYSPKYNFDYPEVKRDEKQVDIFHGMEVKDPYRWLENFNSWETRRFVQLQNGLTRPYLRQCQHRESIRRSLASLMNYTRLGGMKKKAGRYFTLESNGLQNQMSLYVQEGLLGHPRLLLDPNELAEDGTTAIQGFQPSPDGKVVAYKLSDKGSDWVRIYFMDVDNGTLLPDYLPHTKFSNPVWTLDGAGVFYTSYGSDDMLREDQNGTWRKVYYHLLGTNSDDDILVIEHPGTPEWATTPIVSYDGKYLLAFVEADLGPVQIHYLVLEDFLRDLTPKPTLIPIVENFEAEYYYVTNDDKLFYMLTNRNAPNWKIIRIDFDNPEEENWETIIAENPKAVLEWASPVHMDKLVLSYLQNVSTTIQICSLTGSETYVTRPLDFGSSGALYKDRTDSEFFLVSESILTPKVIYRFSFTEHPTSPTMQQFRQSNVAGFNAKDYTLVQKFYASTDGTQVPMFIAYKKNISLGPETPAILHGYGGFNSVSLPYFTPYQAMFMKHFNGVYAIANIRGGGEFGLKWYDGGRLLNKQNTFDDFHAAAEYLIANGYTSSKKLTISGSSNGGLLVAAAINQRPDLYGAAIPDVGVMDVVRYQKWPAGVPWSSDYGDPNNATQFEALIKYSPLHNVGFPPGSNETQYPATLVFTGDKDDRVDPSHSYKLTAELQYKIGRDARQTNPLFLIVQADAGHGAGKPTSKMLDEFTDQFSFICKALHLDFEQ